MSDVSLDKAVTLSREVTSLHFRVITYDHRIGSFTIILDDGSGNTKTIYAPLLSDTLIAAIKTEIEGAIGNAFGSNATIVEAK